MWQLQVFFIRFDEDHVASIVDVLKVIQPLAMGAGSSYKRIMQFRTIFFTRAALLRTDREYSDPSKFQNFVILGSKSEM